MSEKRFDTASYDAERVRQINAARKRKKKKAARRGGFVYFCAVLLVSALLAGIGWLFANDLCALNKEYKEATITVEEGDNLNDVTKKLKSYGLINYKGFFKFVGRFMHANKTIDPGEYTLNTNMDYRSLIVNMHDYELEKVIEEGLIRLTIPEGYTVNEIIDLLVANGVASKEDLEDACANYAFEDYGFLNDELIGNVERMEGFLFPDTYDFDPNRSAVFAIDTMLTGFTLHIDEALNQQILQSGYSMYQVITMASLVEKEAGAQDVMGNFSSVIHNRLASDMPLQLDCTLNYIKGTSTFDLTYDDMEIDSPYNTYLYKGLPYGPICCPGVEAIRATVNPNDTGYYFWYSVDGVTTFFENGSDFDAFAAAHPY